MTKLLAEESDRHWEEGIDVLKKYLQLGGVTHENAFLDKMSFTSKVGRNYDFMKSVQIQKVTTLSVFNTYV